MTATELRIGNLVADYDCSPYYFSVEQITNTADGDVRIHYRNNSITVIVSDVPPIPLTEEWLIKFGLKKHPDNERVIILWSNRNVSFEYWLDDDLFVMAGDYWSEDLPKIQYVHQLQNLYYALTGEELTIKEP